MVLWEITLATAYFLGLRRTYRLALRIQRRVVGPRHPEIRQFLRRRTRSIFDVVVRVVQNIQHKDMGAGGRSTGNSVLRWLDRTKPSAQVGVHGGRPPISSICIPKYAASRSQLLRTGRSIARITDQVKRGRSFFTPWNIPMKTFPTIGMMMQPMKPAVLNGQYRHASHYIPNSSAIGHSRIIGRGEGVLRKDIAQWMLHT
ncbi:hypothetical protein BHM03_00011664 [Ensete ventricosum]|nr:hypothetical protein BHM03_00011664 [Ensete ventricosum]